MKGYIHSVESFGTVDGPGIRMVVFFSGCPMRCKYCHNPDTWNIRSGKDITAEELLAQYNRNRSFYKNGGITASGGEPLVQLDFLTGFFKLAKEQGIHTCLDTSGIVYKAEDISRFDELMKYTDLVMLDIKHIDFDAHKELCGIGNDAVKAFASYLEERNVPVWIRHVVVPTITDKKEDLRALGRYIAGLRNVRALDVLPYHTMGVSKYEELGIEYPLRGLAPMSVADAAAAKAEILKGMKE